MAPPAQSGSPLNPLVTISMLAAWGVLIAIFVVLIFKNKLRPRVAAVLWLASVVVGGVIIGGVPNAVMPISQVLTAIGAGTLGAAVAPMVIVLVVLLATTLFIGRAFCGVACPLGALQELNAKVGFKSSVAAQKRVRWKVTIPRRVALVIRWVFFAVFAIFAVAWSISIVDLANPFQGFKVFANPWVPAILLPIIALSIISVASLFIYRPWCRLLCPFGAIAGLTARASRYKLQRTAACTNCGVCEQVCPTQEAGVDASKGECYLCQRCVAACPQAALVFGKKIARKNTPA